MDRDIKGLLAKLALVFFIIFAGCRREEPAPEVKPLLKTNQAEVNTADDGGITMTGEFILSGRYRSIRYGFHLSTNSSFTDPIIVPAGADNEPGGFNAKVNIGLKPDVKYYVRAWAKTEKYEVFGNIVEFQSIGSSAPVINKIFPAKGIFGDTIMIIGKNFDVYGKENRVFFNEAAAAKIWCKHDTIWAIVPVIILSQNLNMTINVEVFLKRTLMGQPFAIAAPVVSGISISQGQFPDSIKVTGDNFFADYTTLLVDGVATKMLDVTKKSFSFVVPYLKQDRTVKIELNSLKNVYSITDNFHYLGQSILECSANSAWIGDTLKLYAKNTDFRRILLDIKNIDPKLLAWGVQSLFITHKWKDSLAFILKGYPDDSKFNLDIQFGENSLGWPSTTFKTVDQKIIAHRPPLLESIEKSEYVYREPINYKAKGMYWGAEGQSILIKSLDGSVNLSFQFSDFLSNELIYPGDYQMQLSSSDRLSNIKYFTVRAPLIEGVSPLEFSRHDMVQITGKNLPYGSNYKLTQTESGRSFMLQNWWEQNPNKTSQQIIGEDIIGIGNYRLELSIGNKSYKYPGIIEVKDYFKYIKRFTDPFWQTPSVGCGFAINNKLYIPQQSGEISIVDLETGIVRKKQGDYNYDHQPVFFDNRVYLNIVKDGKFVIGSFNETTEDWDALNMDGVSADFSLFGFGVSNSHLVAISKNGDIYQYNQKWTFLSNIKLNFYFIHYVYSANGNLYLCDFYMGKVLVVSTTDWKIVKEISMPGFYENSLRYIFEIQGRMFFCAKPKGEGDFYSDLYKFTTEEIFEALNPKRLKFDFYYHFCPDGKGNVYFVNEGYIYKFNP